MLEESKQGEGERQGERQRGEEKERIEGWMSWSRIYV